MTRVVRFSPLALAVAFLLALDTVSPGQGAKRSDSVVKAKAKVESTAGNKAVIVVQLDIQKGWHLYANPVGNEDLSASQTVLTVTSTAKPQGVKVEYPAGQVKQDKILGNYKVYEDKVEIRATVDRAPGNAGPLEVNVRVAACDDKHCLPPASVRMTLP